MLLHRIINGNQKQRSIVSLCFFLLLFSLNIKGQKDSIPSNFELSFGQSTLFISHGDATQLKKDLNLIVPTNSMLFFAEFRPFNKIKIPIFLNLPTESKQFIENGVLISQRASSTLGAGLEFKLIDFKIPYNSKIEIDIASLGSLLFRENKQLVFAPLITSRIKIIKDSSFIMYLGSSYSLGVNTWGLFYGTGYIF